MIETNEHKEQCAVIQYCDVMKILCFAIPNASALSYLDRIAAKRNMAKLKKEGLRVGIPDLFIPQPSAAGHHGLFIEMKKPKTSTPAGKTSKEQEWWQTQLQLHGYISVICYGANEAINEIEKYKAINKEQS